MQLFKFTVKGDPLDSLRRKERYRLLGAASGNAGPDIVLGFDTHLNRVAAVKKLPKELAGDAARQRAFLNEVRLLSYIDHPGATSVYDVFLEDDAEPCYAMKQMSGLSLRQHLRTRTRGQLLAMFTKLCETMAAVHDKGVVHLDINPDNILAGDYGEVCISGWDHARLFDPRPYQAYLSVAQEAVAAPLENAPPVSGTNPAYAAPELFAEDRNGPGPGADIFSLGVIFYEMMTGVQPFTGADNAAIVHNVRFTMPLAMHEASPGVPFRLSQVCAKMLAKDPFGRYQSFHEILSDLDAFQNSGEAFPTATFRQGDVIFKEGDAGDFAFTVVRGRVQVTRNIDGKEKVIAEFGRDEMVGELAIFTGEQRTATVRAMEPTTIRIMARQTVTQELQKLSPWVGRMVTVLSERFIDLSKRAHR